MSDKFAVILTKLGKNIEGTTREDRVSMVVDYLYDLACQQNSKIKSLESTITSLKNDINFLKSKVH